MCAEVMHICPGMSMDYLGDLTWRDLMLWHDEAMDIWRTERGIATDE